MPLTFTAPIEEIPGVIALTSQSSDRTSALGVLSTTGRFPARPWTDERNWSPLIGIAMLTAKLKLLDAPPHTL
jgi:hypothetical protein